MSGAYTLVNGIYLPNYGQPFSKGANLEITEGQFVTDDNIEYIDINFARKVRENTRWLSASGTDINAINNAKISGVIGIKVNIQSRINNESELNNQIEDLIDEWSEVDNCEVTGRWHLNSAFRSMVRFLSNDGGILIRHHVNTAWKIPYRFEMIGVSMIDVSKYNRQDRVINGLKKDRFGKVTGVYIYDDEFRMSSTLVNISNLIYYSPVWLSIEQYSAVSKLAGILPTIDKIDQYSEAELAAAIEGSKAGAYWETTLYDAILLKAKQEAARSGIDNAQISTDYMKKLKNLSINQNGLTPIPSGDKIHGANNTRDGIYDPLQNSSQRKISAASNQSSQAVYKDIESANYSSIKQSMAFDQIGWSIDFQDIEYHLIRKIIRKLMDVSVSAGLLNIPSYFENPRKYNRFTFGRVSEVDIEPSRTADGIRTKYELGVISKSDVIDTSGKTYEEVTRERISEEIQEEQWRREMFAEANLPVPERNTNEIIAN